MLIKLKIKKKLPMSSSEQTDKIKLCCMVCKKYGAGKLNVASTNQD